MLDDKVRILALVALVMSSVNASAQIIARRGTALVSTMTKNEITIAEDSRIVGNGGYSDNDCKIIALDGKSIFGFSGVRSFEIATPRIDWDSHKVTIRAYKMSTDKTPSDTARKFAILARDVFEEAIKVRGFAKFAQEIGMKPNITHLADAVFAGINGSGEPEQFTVEVVYVPSTRTVTSKAEILSPGKGKYALFAMGSDTSTATEFSSNPATTFRADKERRRWEQTMIGKSFEERMSLFAVQLVKWEIMYTQEPDIGGDVDYVVLTRAGIADHRKPSCQAAEK